MTNALQPAVSDDAPLSRRKVALLIICVVLVTIGALQFVRRRPIREVLIVVRDIPGDFRAARLIAEDPAGVRSILQPTPRSTRDARGDGGPIITPFMFREDPLFVYVAWDGAGRVGLVGTDANNRTRIAWFSESECELHRSFWPFSIPEIRVQFGQDRKPVWVTPDMQWVLGSPDVPPAQFLGEQKLWLKSLLAAARSDAAKQDSRETGKSLKYVQDCCTWLAGHASQLTAEERENLKATAESCDGTRSAAEKAEWNRVAEGLADLDGRLRWLFE